MIARHDGQVILVQGAIPGERVIAAVERVERQVAFASTVDLVSASPDRRSAHADPSCGGCLYAHIEYERQVALKSEVISDAFTRLGRLPVQPPAVAPSPDRDYRMRARLHVRGDRVGFFREGTHDLCDAAATGQLTAASVEAATECVGALARRGVSLSAIEIAENIAADQRAAYVIPAANSKLTDEVLDEALKAAGLTGVSGLAANGLERTAGVPVVSDPLAVLTAGAVAAGALQRHAESFFQANRFLLPALVGAVTAAVPADGAVLDLYAGVGLFSVALAALGRRGITAVEGDRTSGRDLLRNATPFADGAAGLGRERGALSETPRRTCGDDHRRPAENRHLARGDDRRRARSGGEGGLRVVRSRDDGARCPASRRRGIRADVADGLRPVPEHAARGGPRSLRSPRE